jgi:hypothetical protein
VSSASDPVVTLRPVRVADAGAVARIWYHGWQDGHEATFLTSSGNCPVQSRPGRERKPTLGADLGLAELAQRCAIARRAAKAGPRRRRETRLAIRQHQTGAVGPAEPHRPPEAELPDPLRTRRGSYAALPADRDP